MSFFEENKNFFKHLYSELRNLDPVSKQEKYESFKDQIKKRTSEYYQKIKSADNNQTLLNDDYFFNNLIEYIEHYDAGEDQRLLKKYRFYKDLIECIGPYDFHYILMNLFLDNDFIKLIPSFYTNEDFKSLLERSKTPMASFILGFNRKLNGSLSVEKEFSTYLKKAFYDFIPTDNNTWEEKNYKTKSSINHKYAQYLIQSVTLELPYWQSIIHNHLLFIKAYNYLDYFKKDKTFKSILFINEMINNFKLEKQKHNIKLVKLVDKIEDEIHSNSFVEYNKTPVCLSESLALNISTGLANRIREFDALLNIQSTVNNTDPNSYFDIYKLADRVSLQEFNYYLNKKIDSGVVISSEEIRRIEDDPNPILIQAKHLIFKKLYLFEYLALKCQ